MHQPTPRTCTTKHDADEVSHCHGLTKGRGEKGQRGRDWCAWMWWTLHIFDAFPGGSKGAPEEVQQIGCLFPPPPLPSPHGPCLPHPALDIHIYMIH